MFQAILCSSSGGQNCISTASGIVTLCERPCSAPVESGLVIKTKKKRSPSIGTTILPSVSILLAFNGTKLLLPHLQRPVLDSHTASHARASCF
jgi:hypothetical protein